jgi:hypothetical protein
VDVKQKEGVITHKNVFENKIQQPTRKQPASLFCLNLQQQTKLYLTTSSILPTPPFPKKKKKKNGPQQSPRFNLPCTSRACSLKVLPK